MFNTFFYYLRAKGLDISMKEWLTLSEALALGLGIFIAAVFPVGCLMFLVAFLLIGCGIACLKRR